MLGSLSWRIQNHTSAVQLLDEWHLKLKVGTLPSKPGERIKGVRQVDLCDWPDWQQGVQYKMIK